MAPRMKLHRQLGRLEDRLSLAAHYVIARTQPHELGATKLNKILWFSDLECYRAYGHTVTGLDKYIRMPKGPVPDGIEHAIRYLKKEKSIIERAALVSAYTRREFVWLRKPPISAFGPEEIDILSVFIDIIKDQPANLKAM